ncbi:uncharacterized protein LOC134095557 [Sardina pilchardus]|uniref:uncharacterized protein LOC134095557 n=1 Tax=Sardina pilchardus TaxID=27697 RepID=UPI002E12591D
MCVLLQQMRAFTGLLLITSIYGLDSMCDVTQDAACYGALGGPVYLQLMRNTRGYGLSLSNGSSHVFKFRRSKPVFYYEFNTTSVLQRWQFAPDNGTMIINSTERRDAGTYKVQITEESTGKSVGEYTVQLTIEAPVSDVDLSITCSANGERRAICSSNGDSPQYSWSLYGRPLNETSTNQCIEKCTETDLTNNKTHVSNDPDNNHGDNKNKTSPVVQKDSSSLRSCNSSAETPESSSSCIDLLEGTQGNLTCSARNNISSATKTQPLPSCTITTTPPPPTTTPTAPTSMSTAAMTTNNGASMATNKTTSNQGNSTTTEENKELPDHFIYYLGAAVLGGVVFLCVSVAAFCICKKKKKNTLTTDGQSQDVVYSQCRKNPSSPPGDSYEVEYAEVSILMKKERKERTREDDTVEYGEIKLPGSTNHIPAEAPEPTNHTPGEESVYAQVRKKGQR